MLDNKEIKRLDNRLINRELTSMTFPLTVRRIKRYTLNWYNVLKCTEDELIKNRGTL